MTTTYFTQNGFNLARKEIARLQEEIEECNRKIGHTVSLDNDLRENPEFMALRTKAEYELPAKIQHISELISNYVIIENMPHIRVATPDCIDVGHEVTLVSDDGDQRIVTILGYGDSDPDKQVVSYLTPIGQQLLHKEIGDDVCLPFRGRVITYHINNIKISPLVNAIV